MKLTRDQVNVLIKNGQSAGLTGKEVLDGLVQRGYEPEGIDINIAKQEIAKSQAIKDDATIGSRLKQDIVEGRQNIQNINDSDASIGTKIAQNAAVVTGLPLKAAFDILPKPTRDAFSFVTDVMGQGFKLGVDKLADTKLFKEIGALEAQGFINPKDNPDFYKLKDTLAGIAASGETAGNVATLYGGVKTGVDVADATITGTKNLTNTIKTSGENAYDALKNKTSNVYTKLSDKLALNKIDAKTQTILKETPVEKLDVAIRQGQAALADPRINTPLQEAGNQVNQAVKLIKNDLSTIGSQKSELLQSVGKTKVPNIALKQIDKVKPLLQTKLTNAERGLVNQYLEELQSLGKNPTAASVDATIDKLQATLFEKKGGVSIPTTPRIQSFINKSIGELNGELKSAVDTALGSNAYSTINSSYATRINLFNKLNKALGEEAVKGGSLVKRFFSPSDAGTKKIFSDIKSFYGIDLAQDATLARFVMETLGDTRAASLLELPPTTPSGIVAKGLDLVEKKLTSPKKVFQTARKISN